MRYWARRIGEIGGSTVPPEGAVPVGPRGPGGGCPARGGVVGARSCATHTPAAVPATTRRRPRLTTRQLSTDVLRSRGRVYPKRGRGAGLGGPRHHVR